MTEDQLKEQVAFYQELSAHQANEIGRLSTEVIVASMKINKLTAQLDNATKTEVAK